MRTMNQERRTAVWHVTQRERSQCEQTKCFTVHLTCYMARKRQQQRKRPTKQHDNRQAGPWQWVCVATFDTFIVPRDNANLLIIMLPSVGTNILKLPKIPLYTNGQELQLPTDLDGLTQSLYVQSIIKSTAQWAWLATLLAGYYSLQTHTNA